MKITQDTVYAHDEYGEVLIVDVHHVYLTFRTLS